MANKKGGNDLFKKLTQLFKSGPVVRRKVRNIDTRVAMPDSKSSAIGIFSKSTSPTYSFITANAYTLQERLARYNDFVEMEYCLAGDTKIAVPDGFKTIKELADEYGLEKEFIVFSYDHENKKITPALAKQARVTRVDVCYKVTFDNGKTITGSDNHRLMRRDGSYCMIKDLIVGEAMMPFYRNTHHGYQYIYTMNREQSKSGWRSEHRVMAEWAAGRRLNKDEVVHHINFVRHDNRPENLKIMLAEDHYKYHLENVLRLNKEKWSSENSVWIENFKKTHSTWMRENNPAKRNDVSFALILQFCETQGFSQKKLCEYFSTDPNVIKRRLRENGFKDFVSFVKAYDNGRNVYSNNKKDVSFQDVCNNYHHNATINDLAKKLCVSQTVVQNRLREAGFDGFKDFKVRYENLKVVSIEKMGVQELYDLTVDGFKNFATDSVISHNTAEISSALDIYADETVAQDEKGRSLHVYSNNPKIRQTLEDLFYNTLNIEFNMRPWVRNLCKNGDMFLLNDVSPDLGVINVIPIPINEIEREEGYDREDPMAVRFRWVAQGNKILENWEVTHIRLMGNDMFLPYGASVLEGARRIWRQLVLIEDAMLVYRIVRSPERRVFYIDIGNSSPDEIPHIMEQARTTLRSQQIIDKTTGRVDLRYNPLSVDEDYFIPVRGSESGTRIDTLQGGQNTATVEDVQYIQRKLFAALKVPKAYLGYDEMLSSKATLAQEDIRFSRTISMIQRTIISEFNKIAIIHLAANGWTGEDLLNFSLRLSNPSTVAQQQKLELYRTKFEIAGTVPEGLLSRAWIQKNIIGLSSEEMVQIERELLDDAASASAREAAAAIGAGGGDAGGGGGGGGAPPPAGGPDDMGAPPGDAGGEPPPENAGASEEEEKELLTSGDDIEEQETFHLSMKDDNAPIKAQNQLQRTLYNRGRRRTHGASKTHMPDFNKMTGNSKELNDPYDSDFFRGQSTNPLAESINFSSDIFDDEQMFEISKPVMSLDIVELIRKMNVKFGKFQRPERQQFINESTDVVEIEKLDELDVFIQGDDEKGDE